MGVLDQPGFWWGTGGAAVVYAVVAGIRLWSLLDTGNEISPMAARRAIADGRIKHVIDVRRQDEWDAGHFPGAIHIPVDKIMTSKKLTRVPKDAHILVYCRTGKRAKRAVDRLHNSGFENVQYIADNYRSLIA